MCVFERVGFCSRSGLLAQATTLTDKAPTRRRAQTSLFIKTAGREIGLTIERLRLATILKGINGTKDRGQHRLSSCCFLCASPFLLRWPTRTCCWFQQHCHMRNCGVVGSHAFRCLGFYPNLSGLYATQLSHTCLDPGAVWTNLRLSRHQCGAPVGHAKSSLP